MMGDNTDREKYETYQRARQVIEQFEDLVVIDKSALNALRAELARIHELLVASETRADSAEAEARDLRIEVARLDARVKVLSAGLLIFKSKHPGEIRGEVELAALGIAQKCAPWKGELFGEHNPVDLMKKALGNEVEK